MTKSFWFTLKQPIIGLSPMDGITDPAFRAIVDDIGHPTVLYTEFVSADGLCRNQRLLRTFTIHKTNTPLIGQLFGSNPDTMAEAAAILLEKTNVMGIDINMGCPNRRVAQHGAGAALIQKPDAAQKLILCVREVIQKSGKSIGLSVKTRIGYDSIITTEWISILLETPIDAIALHGRTLKQQYTGTANWDEIKIASDLAGKKHVLLLGNGDITSYTDAINKVSQYSPDGVLIGRSSLGNPWVFTGHTSTLDERIEAAIQHCRYFESLTPEANPLSLRKHLAWYMKSFAHASDIRSQLMRITTTTEAMKILKSL
ncbi:MAG: tRNA-dihydrouridine synthase family protein [Candidatus Gottesmanbacteria bacterium]